MHLSILRSGIFLALLLGASAATAQTELFFATGVDSTGWAQAQSNADGHVLIESPQYPRGLWLHLVDEAGDALAGLQVEYQGQPDSLVAIHCVDPAGGVRETLLWTRADGTPLRLTLKPEKVGDLPAGVAPIDWRIDPIAEALLEPMAEARRINWEEMAAFLRARWQDQAGLVGLVAVRIQSGTTSITLVAEVDRPETIETLVAYLQQMHRPAGTSLGERPDLYVQVFRGRLALQQVVILYVPLFADANLEGVVRQVLGRPQGHLTPEDVASLTTLLAVSKAIRSLAGIGHLTALQRLDLSDNQITDLTPLNQLTNLNNLGLNDNRIVNLTPLAFLTNLETLWLASNQIVDITPLNPLTNLETLWLASNQIVDITPLNPLTNLETLELADNQIVDITPLNQLTNLAWLLLGYNQIVDLSPLTQLTKLSWLRLPRNEIVDLSSLNQLTNLETLLLSSNRISDLAPLANLTNLEALELDNNEIVDLGALKHLTQLGWLRLHVNQIVDLAPLNQLTNLAWLRLDHNQIVDVSSLVANPGLGEGDVVILEANPLSAQARNEQIPTLEARGVTVHY